jgi:hypothetical protein
VTYATTGNAKAITKRSKRPRFALPFILVFLPFVSFSHLSSGRGFRLRSDHLSSHLEVIGMKRRIAIVLVACGCLLLVLAGASPAEAEDSPEVVTARKARDQAEIESLRKVIDKARSEAQQHGTAGRLAPSTG